MSASQCPVHGVVLTFKGTGCPMCIDIANAAEREGRSPAVAMPGVFIGDQSRPWPSPHVSEADPFVELARSMAPELAVLLRSVAYGATLIVETRASHPGEYIASLSNAGNSALDGLQTVVAHDFQLSKALSDLATAYVRKNEQRSDPTR